jgi:hypothetical protein
MYIFLDESGKPEVYSAKGRNLVEDGVATRFLVIATVKTSDHLLLQQRVTDFKSQLLAESDLRNTFSAAYALDAFHANKDYPAVRNKMYQFITELDDIEIHVIVAEKLKCSKSLRENPIKLYGLLAGLNLQGICHQDALAEIIFSRQDSGKVLKKELELEVERIRESAWSHHRKSHEGIKLTYQHNPHYSHGGLQIADYVAYAVFQYYEKGNPEYLKVIKDRVRHIHDYTQKKHFTRSRPLELS